MLRALLPATLLCWGSLTAAQIDNIEFQPPTMTQPWELTQQINNNSGSALIFTPQEPEYDFYSPFAYNENNYDDCTQLFYATLHYTSYNPQINPKELEEQLELISPFFQYQFYLIHQDDTSALLEFYGFDEDGFVAYGIIRKMQSENGTVTLTYIVDEDTAIMKARQPCLKAMQAAKTCQ